MVTNYERPVLKVLLERLREPVRFIQIVIGPRQSGKSTMAGQIEKRFPNLLIASADGPSPPGPDWIDAQWKKAAAEKRPLLILDEIQKVPKWSEAVKACWDRDRNRPFHLVLLGSSALLMQKGLNESLLGRFEHIRSPHWSYVECKEAFGLSLDEYLFFGGYPGCFDGLPPLWKDDARWRAYIMNSITEPAISKDILQGWPLAKPALFRQAFGLACQMPAKILSYNKMLGRLQDRGNSTTVKQYFDLLNGAFLVTGLQNYSGSPSSRHKSIPKIVVRNNAHISAGGVHTFEEMKNDPALRGVYLENAVGAHLLNAIGLTPRNLFYWRERDKHEVDYVVSLGKRLYGFEVTSGRADKKSERSLFEKIYRSARTFLIGKGGMEPEEFFLSDPARFFGSDFNALASAGIAPAESDDPHPYSDGR